MVSITVSDQRKLIVAEMLGQGYRQADIARKLGISEGAVSRIISRAKEKGLEPQEAVKERVDSPEAELICYVLQVTGWTQKELAEKLGKSKNIISEWLSGTKRPGKETIERLNQLTRG